MLVSARRAWLGTDRSATRAMKGSVRCQSCFLVGGGSSCRKESLLGCWVPMSVRFLPIPAAGVWLAVDDLVTTPPRAVWLLDFMCVVILCVCCFFLKFCKTILNVSFVPRFWSRSGLGAVALDLYVLFSYNLRFWPVDRFYIWVCLCKVSQKVGLKFWRESTGRKVFESFCCIVGGMGLLSRGMRMSSVWFCDNWPVDHA